MLSRPAGRNPFELSESLYYCVGRFKRSRCNCYHKTHYIGFTSQINGVFIQLLTQLIVGLVIFVINLNTVFYSNSILFSFY